MSEKEWETLERDHGARHWFTGDPAGGDHRPDCWCVKKREALDSIRKQHEKLVEAGGELAAAAEAFKVDRHDMSRCREMGGTGRPCGTCRRLVKAASAYRALTPDNGEGTG